MTGGERSAATRGAPRALVGILLGPPAFVALVLLVRRSDDVSWPLALGLVGLGALGLALAPRRRLAGPVLALAVVAASLLWPEMGLRAAGFRFHPAGVVEFGYPRPADFVGLERDPELFWRLAPGSERVNSRGFVGPEFELEKPAGVLRLLFFGDSCAWQGYPELVAQELAAGAGPDAPRAEALNLAVPGYSSHQGRILAERWSAALAPDVGVVVFGWNDHWRAYGSIDSERKASTPRLAPLLERSRLVQWLASRAARASSRPLDLPRVPLDEYRANLEAIGRALGDAGARVVLSTAPSAHARRGVPPHLVARGFAADEASVLALHARYNEVVRELAAARGWLLVDQERAAAEPGAEAFFGEDGIHFTQAGARWMAGAIAAAIRESVLAGR